MKKDGKEAAKTIALLIFCVFSLLLAGEYFTGHGGGNPDNGGAMERTQDAVSNARNGVDESGAKLEEATGELNNASAGLDDASGTAGKLEETTGESARELDQLAGVINEGKESTERSRELIEEIERGNQRNAKDRTAAKNPT